MKSKTDYKDRTVRVDLTIYIETLADSASDAFDFAEREINLMIKNGDASVSHEIHGFSELKD